MSKPQVTTHYVDGRPSETRDMTDEEIAQLPTGLLPENDLPNEADNDNIEPV